MFPKLRVKRLLEMSETLQLLFSSRVITLFLKILYASQKAECKRVFLVLLRKQNIKDIPRVFFERATKILKFKAFLISVKK